MAGLHVFLIRHGETALNADGVLRGQIDVALDAVGVAEALALGEMFRELPLSAVVSSPLARAVSTARPVALACRSALTIDDRLRDRFYAEWAGQSLSRVEKQFGSIDAAPSVESSRLLEARAEEAFRDAIAQGEIAGGMALVTHDAVLRALLRRLVPTLNVASLVLPTGSWTELVQHGGPDRWTADRIGEVPGSGRRPVLSFS